MTSAIQKYIDDNGGATQHYGWFVGITADPERRLFRDHKVNKRDGSWIYGPASSSGDAREIERHFLDLGCHGGSGRDGSDAVYVYAYRIAWYSQEPASMEPNPSIKHNLQPREENSYPVSEAALDSLASFSFMASLVAGLGTVFAGVVVSTALQANSPWTARDYIGVVGGLAASIVLFVWSWREVTQGRSLLQRIKRKPKPNPGNNGNGGIRSLGGEGRSQDRT